MQRKPTVWQDHLINDVIYSEYPERSMYSFLFEKTEDCLSDTAIEFEGKKTTYRKLRRQIDHAAGSLAAAGIRKGDVISVISPNIPQAVITIYAANKLGAAANIMHPLLSSTELLSHIEETGSKAVFILDSLYGKIACHEWKDAVPLIVLYSVRDSLGFPKKLFIKRTDVKDMGGRVTSWNAFLKDTAADTEYTEGDPDDTAVILYSGGTTGIPKGVCLTNRNINSYAVQGHEAGACMLKARSLAVLPIFHGFGLCSGIHNMLTCKSHIYLVPAYDAVKCSSLIFRKKIEVIFAIPAMYDALLHCDEIEKSDCRFFKLLYCGGDKLPSRTERRFNSVMEKKGLSTRIIVGYGLTECVAGCTSNAMFVQKEGTAGMALPDNELKIVAPGTENELPLGETGELCVSGPAVMKAYFNNESATKKALKTHGDGKTWLHTGDAFSVDKDGFYTFHSRLSRMLVVNGFNVFPETVESALMKVEGVSGCCAVGLESKTGGDRVAAAVCLKDGFSSLTPEHIIEQCKGFLPEYALPSKMLIMKKLPVTKMGKTDYLKVSEKLREA